MIIWIKRLLGLNNIHWIDNTEKVLPHLEGEKYLLVETAGDSPMLFTEAQYVIAKRRARQTLIDPQS
jgi:hypothetical protein